MEEDFGISDDLQAKAEPLEEKLKPKLNHLITVGRISAPLSLSLSLSLKSQPRYKYLILRFKKLI